MRKAEIIAAIAIVAGFILMALNIGFGSIVLVGGIILLMLIYFPMGYAFFNLVSLEDSTKKESFREVNTKRFVGAIVVGFSLALILFGVIAKIFLWSDANLILGAGISFNVLAFINAAFYYFRSKVKHYKRVLSRMLVIGFAGVLVFAASEEVISSILHVEGSASSVHSDENYSRASGRNAPDSE